MNQNNDGPPQVPLQPSSGLTVSVVSINFGSKIVQMDSERNRINQSIDADNPMSLQNLRSSTRKDNSLQNPTPKPSPDSIPAGTDFMPKKSHLPKHMQSGPAPDRKDSVTSNHGSQLSINNVSNKADEGSPLLARPKDYNDSFKIMPVMKITEEQSEPEHTNLDLSRGSRKSISQKSEKGKYYHAAREPINTMGKIMGFMNKPLYQANKGEDSRALIRSGQFISMKNREKSYKNGYGIGHQQTLIPKGFDPFKRLDI